MLIGSKLFRSNVTFRPISSGSMSCDYPLSIINILFIEPGHLNNREFHTNLVSVPQKSPARKLIQTR